MANGLFKLEVVLLVHICFDCFDIQPYGFLVDVQTATYREPCFGKHSHPWSFGNSDGLMG